jgi:pimeloyl-ACP methyl ester carboxylesterase
MTTTTIGVTQSRYGAQRWTESGHGPPMLLLHGIYAGAGAHEWDALVGELSATHRVRVPDLLGFGRSDRPAIRYTQRVLLEAVASLVDDLPPAATVVASSLTGAYAVHAMARDFTAARTLVLITPTGLGSHDHDLPDMVSSLAEAGWRRTPLGDVLTRALTSRPSIGWFLRNRAYRDAERVTDAVLDRHRRAGRGPGAKYPIGAFVSNRLAIRVDRADVARLQPTVIWGCGQRFTDDAESDRWEDAGALVLRLPSGQPQAEEPSTVAAVVTKTAQFADAAAAID